VKPSLSIHPEDPTVAIFKLATGEEIRVSLEDEMGIEGFKLYVGSSKLLVVRPRSGNSLELLTPRSLVELEQQCSEIGRQNREKSKRP
jgi:hypothetical protein